MSQIKLKCPHCDEVLLLDAGFAGGVCRCSGCGTIISVPQLAETVKRAKQSRPDAPPTRPHKLRPGDPASTHAPSPGQMPRIPKVPPGSSNFKMPRATEPQTRAGATLLVEPNEIRQHKAAKRPAIEPGAPPRRKGRLGVRLVVVIVFVTGFGALMAGLLVAIRVGMSGRTQSIEQAQAVAKSRYDPQVNLYLVDAPNFMGILTEGRATLLVDASSASSPWLGLIKDAVASGTGFPYAHVIAQVVVATDHDPAAFPQNPEPLVDWNPNALDQFLGSIRAYRQANLPEALRRVLEGAPEHIVLVVGRSPAPEQAAEIRSIMDARRGTRVDVLAVDTEAGALRDLAERHAGHYASISAALLRQWHEESRPEIDEAPRPTLNKTPAVSARTATEEAGSPQDP